MSDDSTRAPHPAAPAAAPARARSATLALAPAEEPAHPRPPAPVPGAQLPVPPLPTVLPDERPVADLFTRLYGRLRSFALGIVQDGDAAEDVNQDAFLDLWLEIEKDPAFLHSIESPDAYIHTLVLNRGRRSKRSGRRRKERESFFSGGLLRIGRDWMDPFRTTHNRGIAAATKAGVEKLPERTRQVFELVREHGLKYKEVAEMLDMSVNTVGQHMGRAYDLLGVSLTEAGHGPDGPGAGRRRGKGAGR